MATKTTKAKASNSTKTYVPYAFDPNNIPKLGLAVTLPFKVPGMKSKEATEIRYKAKKELGVRTIRPPHLGHFLSVLNAELMTQNAIDFLNAVKAIRNERTMEYCCNMKWNDIYHSGKSFPYQVFVGKLRNLGHIWDDAKGVWREELEWDAVEDTNVFEEGSIPIQASVKYIKRPPFADVSEAFPKIDDAIMEKINGFVGKSVLQRNLTGEYYVDSEDMTEPLWDMLVQEKYASGFIGYLNPDRINEANVKICYQKWQRKPYERYKIIFGKEILLPGFYSDIGG